MSKKQKRAEKMAAFREALAVYDADDSMGEYAALMAACHDAGIEYGSDTMIAALKENTP